MEETLEASIARIFDVKVPDVEQTMGEQPRPAEPEPAAAATAPPAPQVSNLLQEARSAYDRAIQAQRQGDWARYGEEIRKLGKILEDLNRAGKQ